MQQAISKNLKISVYKIKRLEKLLILNKSNSIKMQHLKNNSFLNIMEKKVKIASLLKIYYIIRKTLLSSMSSFRSSLIMFIFRSKSVRKRGRRKKRVQLNNMDLGSVVILPPSTRRVDCCKKGMTIWKQYWKML